MLSVTAANSPVSCWWRDIPIQDSLSPAIRGRWHEPIKPLPVTLDSTALQMAIKLHELDCSETSRGKLEIFIPFLCWVSQTWGGNLGDP